MYLPKHFQANEAETAELLDGIVAADLVSATNEGPYVTFLPLIYEPPPPRENAGDGEPEFGSLLGHVARKNDHWRLETIGESMVIAHGPDAYISPGWYATKREHGRVVPTWNYLAANIYGELVIHDDVTWLEAFVRRLTTQHEAFRDDPWSVDDAPREYTDSQLKAIVGVELRITRIEAKAKLSQNRSAADLDGMIGGLEQRHRANDVALATAAERSRRN